MIQASVEEQTFSQKEVEEEKDIVRSVLADILQINRKSVSHSFASRESISQKVDQFRQKLFDPSWKLIREKDGFSAWSMKENEYNVIAVKSRTFIPFPLYKTWPKFLTLMQKFEELDSHAIMTTYLEGKPDTREHKNKNELQIFLLIFLKKHFMLHKHCIEVPLLLQEN